MISNYIYNQVCEIFKDDIEKCEQREALREIRYRSIKAILILEKNIKIKKGRKDSFYVNKKGEIVITGSLKMRKYLSHAT